jgi:hypothetical protein
MMLTAVAPDVIAAERGFFNELVQGSAADSFAAEDSTYVTDSYLDELYAPGLTLERVNNLVQAKALAWLGLHKLPGQASLENDAFERIINLYQLIQFRYSAGSGQRAGEIALAVSYLAQDKFRDLGGDWLQMFGNVFSTLTHLVALPEITAFDEGERFYRERQIKASIVWHELELNELVVTDV